MSDATSEASAVPFSCGAALEVEPRIRARAGRGAHGARADCSCSACCRSERPRHVPGRFCDFEAGRGSGGAESGAAAAAGDCATPSARLGKWTLARGDCASGGSAREFGGAGRGVVASPTARFYPTPLTMVLLVRFLIRAYQWTVSPLLSWLGGPSTGCRFHPTCSAYFLEAVERHGALRGSWLGLKRLGALPAVGRAGGGSGSGAIWEGPRRPDLRRAKAAPTFQSAGSRLGL